MTPAKTMVPNEDLSALVWLSAHYALGRSSYVVGEAVALTLHTIVAPTFDEAVTRALDIADAEVEP